jgi:hypothetical protein
MPKAARGRIDRRDMPSQRFFQLSGPLVMVGVSTGRLKLR